MTRLPPEVGIRDASPLIGDPEFARGGGVERTDYIPGNRSLVKDQGLVLEPLPGEVRLWSQTTVSALFDDSLTQAARLEQVTASDIRRVAKLILQPERMAAAAIGPFAKTTEFAKMMKW